MTILSDADDPSAGAIGLRCLDQLPPTDLLTFQGAFAAAKHLENGRLSDKAAWT